MGEVSTLEETVLQHENCYLVEVGLIFGVGGGVYSGKLIPGGGDEKSFGWWGWIHPHPTPPTPLALVRKTLIGFNFKFKIQFFMLGSEYD